MGQQRTDSSRNARRYDATTVSVGPGDGDDGHWLLDVRTLRGADSGCDGKSIRPVLDNAAVPRPVLGSTRAC